MGSAYWALSSCTSTMSSLGGSPKAISIVTEGTKDSHIRRGCDRYLHGWSRLTRLHARMYEPYRIHLYIFPSLLRSCRGVYKYSLVDLIKSVFTINARCLSWYIEEIELVMSDVHAVVVSISNKLPSWACHQMHHMIPLSQQAMISRLHVDWLSPSQWQWIYPYSDRSPLLCYTYEMNSRYLALSWPWLVPVWCSDLFEE